MRNIFRWLLVAIPATWTNSWLSYIQNKLAIAYRTRLTQEVMKQYLGEEGDRTSGKIYYKLGTLRRSSTKILLDRTSQLIWTTELKTQTSQSNTVILWSYILSFLRQNDYT